MPDEKVPSARQGDVDRLTAPYMTALFYSREVALRALENLLRDDLVAPADIRLMPDPVESANDLSDPEHAELEGAGLLQRLFDHLARARKAAEEDGEDHPGYLMILRLRSNAQQASALMILMEGDASDIEEHASLAEATAQTAVDPQEMPALR